MDIFLWIFVGIVIAAIPIFLGFLRRGLIPVLISFVFVVLYIFLFVFADVMSPYGLSYEGSLIILFRTYITIAIVTSLIAYFVSKNKQIDFSNDKFYDDNLFYQYGQLVQTELIPINLPDGYQKNDGLEEQLDIKSNLQSYLIEQLNLRFNSDTAYQFNQTKISDLYLKSDRRDFCLFSFTTIRHSMINYCVNCKYVGDQLVINTKVFIRSYYNWYDVLLHVVSAPLHSWSWIYSFLKKTYSLSSRLGSLYQNNSFDQIDIESYIKSASFTVISSIEKFATDNNLMSSELQQVIVNNINNTQNISIQKSKGISFGKLSIGNKRN